MKGWNKIKIQDLGTVITGNTPPRKNPELYGSHTVFIKPTDVSEDTRYTFHPEECYSELGYKKYIKSLIPKGSTCVVTIGSIGKKITQAHCDCFINQAMNAVIPNENYDPNFVYYLLKHNLHSVKALDSGTASGRENVSKSSFSSIEVYVPKDKSTQTKIGNLLSEFDDLIENIYLRIQLIEEALNHQFESCFNNAKNIEVPILQIADFVKGFEPGANNYLEEATSGTIPFLRVGDLNKRESSTFIQKSIVKGGIANHEDILLSLDGTVGLVKIGLFGAYSSGVRKVVSKSPLHKAYIYAYLKSQHGQNTINTYARGSTILHAGSAIPKMKIRLPQEKLMNQFAAFANPSLELIVNLMKQNKLLQESRDILLPRLMNGTISVEKAEAKVVSISQPKQKETTWEFKEAVLISMLTEKFGNEKFPLGRKRYTKLSYLFHRHADNQMQNYLRKAAGPYNPKTKYAGPEKIAHQNGYVADHKNGNLTGFIAGKNISAAKTYFENYWSIDYLNWLDTNFHYKSNDQLELYATVDNAMVELHEKNKPVNVEAVKTIIKTEKEWKAKLERDIFSDANIQKAINYLPTLFNYESS